MKCTLQGYLDLQGLCIFRLSKCRMSSSCHSRWLVGEGSDNNDAVDHGEDQVLGDDDSQGGHERGG